MKKLIALSCVIVLLGAGCFGSSSSGGSDGGIFKTFNAGEDWAQTVLVPTAQGIGTLSSSNVLSMKMDPQDKDFLYIGTRSNGMLYSEDAGVSWRQPRNSALQSDTVYDVAVDASSVCTVYAARGSRLYQSTDCMRSFDSETYVETRTGVYIGVVAADWYDSNTLWIGLSNGDVLKSEDKGTTWRTSLKTGKEISEILVSNADSRNILVSTYQDGIWRTDDRGDSWNQVESEIESLKDANEVSALVQTADAGTVIAASTYGLHKSTDFGETWETLRLVTSSGQIKIRAVAMDPENPNTLFYAASSTFYRSLDGGVTWETERFNSSRVPRAMLVDPDDSSVLYVGVASALD